MFLPMGKPAFSMKHSRMSDKSGWASRSSADSEFPSYTGDHIPYVPGRTWIPVVQKEPLRSERSGAFRLTRIQEDLYYLDSSSFWFGLSLMIYPDLVNGVNFHITLDRCSTFNSRLLPSNCLNCNSFSWSASATLTRSPAGPFLTILPSFTAVINILL